MKHYIYILSLLFLLAGCQDKKKQKEIIQTNQEEFWTEELSDEVVTIGYGVESDTIHYEDGTVIYWHEQLHNSPFHRMTEMFRPVDRLIARTARQDGRATDQIFLYEYGKDNRLQCIHDFCSADFADNQDELDGLKHVIDSLYLHLNKTVYEDEWDYIDYRIDYDMQGQQTGLYSKVLGKRIDRNTFGPADSYEVKTFENCNFWQSDLHGGTLLVCQLWGPEKEAVKAYTGIRALAVNLKKIWCKEYKDGQLVKVTFFHNTNDQNEERSHTVSYSRQADGSCLYTIIDKDDVTTEYVWKNGLPVKCTKTSKYNTVLYKAEFGLDGMDIRINESVYNYRSRKLEGQPVKYQPSQYYDEGQIMNITRLIWDEYDSIMLPPESYLY